MYLAGFQSANNSPAFTYAQKSLTVALYFSTHGLVGLSTPIALTIRLIKKGRNERHTPAIHKQLLIGTNSELQYNTIISIDNVWT